MEWGEALAIVIERSKAGGNHGHDRYGILCDEASPDHLLWRARMIEKATGEPVKPALVRSSPAVAETIARTRAMNACPFRSTGPGCGCSGGRCALRGGAIVSHLDCFPCLERFD